MSKPWTQQECAPDGRGYGDERAQVGPHSESGHEGQQDPTAAGLAYAEQSFGKTSIAALGLAVHAARSEYHAAFLEHIDRLEAVYLDELMALNDPEEGLRAFLEKRRPVWAHS